MKRLLALKGRLQARFLLVSITVFVLAMSVVPAFAQATPETTAPGSAALIAGGSEAMETWGLWGYIIAAMIIGLALFVFRGILRSAKRA